MSSVLEQVSGKLAEGHPLTFEDVQSLVGVTDLVRLGMLADEARRRRHGSRATFVRVADVACDAATTAEWPATTGEVRITGAPASLDAALEHARVVAARANGTPVSAYSLADLERLAGDSKTLTRFVDGLEECGVSAIAEAPLDLLHDREAALQAVRDAGLPVARVTVQARPHHGRRAAVAARGQGAAEAYRHGARVRAAAARHRRATGVDRVRRRAGGRARAAVARQRRVDPGRLGALRPQARAGRVAVRRRRHRQRLGRRRWSTEGRRRAPLEEIRRNILAAGLEPVERTAVAAAIGAAHEPRSASARSGISMRRPLVARLDDDRPGSTSRYDVPSECARLLHEGQVDVGLIPSIEYLRGGRTRSLPGMAIASDGPVASVAIFTRGPIERIASIALDTSSRTSVALTRVLCRERLRHCARRSCRTAPTWPRCSGLRRGAAHRRPRADSTPDARGGRCSRRSTSATRGRRMTGLPFVWAFWAGRRPALSPDVVQALAAAQARAARRRDAIADAAAHGDSPARAERGRALPAGEYPGTISATRERAALAALLSLAARKPAS